MTKYLGLLGHPLTHSLSPDIHQAFARQLKMSISYELFDVMPDQFPTTFLQLQQQGKRGANITVPYKQKAWQLCNKLSYQAKLAGSVNTVLFHENGMIYGYNTDGTGLVNDLLNNQITLKQQKILLIGAGGAARGVIIPLLERLPTDLVITNRNLAKAQDLVAEFSQFGNISSCAFSELANQSFDVIINATSASMQQQELPLPKEIINAGTSCYDIYYANSPTKFLSWAKQHGAKKYLDGLGMLVEQAAQAFYLWCNLKPQTKSVIELYSCDKSN